MPIVTSSRPSYSMIDAAPLPSPPYPSIHIYIYIRRRTPTLTPISFWRYMASMHYLCGDSWQPLSPTSLTRTERELPVLYTGRLLRNILSLRNVDFSDKLNLFQL